MVSFPPSTHHLSLAGHLPLLDETPLCELFASLDNDWNAIVGFVSAFVRQWPGRLARIDERLSARDADGALTAVRSLKVSSQMIGATQLTSLSIELESIVLAGDFAAGTARVETLRQVGTDTLLELRARGAATDRGLLDSP